LGSFEFIQLADPQFGMRDSVARAGVEAASRALRAAGFLSEDDPDPVMPDPHEDGLAREARHLEVAFGEASRRNVAFAVVCGDMVNSTLEPAELEALRTARKSLREDIPLHWVPGNHDVAEDFTRGPTADGLAWYREAFGEHYYAFRAQDAYFVALNSELLTDPSQVPEEGARQLRFIEDTLASEESRSAAQRVVFMHRPLFVGTVDAHDQQAVPLPQREHLLRLFEHYDVRTVMAGHRHRELHSRDGDLEVIATTAVGYSLSGPSGFRTVEIDGDRLSHEFHAVEDDPRLAG
jgi:3',5'-cyclic AMP phosphodiesterase CpdA